MHITTETNVVNSAKRYYTVEKQNYNFQVPSNRIVECAADCGDLTYYDPTPGSDTHYSYSFRDLSFQKHGCGRDS